MGLRASFKCTIIIMAAMISLSLPYASQAADKKPKLSQSVKTEYQKCVADLSEQPSIDAKTVCEKRIQLAQQTIKLERQKIEENCALQNQLVNYYLKQMNECHQNIHNSNIEDAYQFINVGTFPGLRQTPTTATQYGTDTAKASGVLIVIPQVGTRKGEYIVVGTATIAEDTQLIRTDAHTILEDGDLLVSNLYFAPGAQGPFNLTDNKPKVLIPVNIDEEEINKNAGKRTGFEATETRDFDNIVLKLKKNVNEYKDSKENLLNLKPFQIKSMSAYQVEDYLQQEHTWIEMAVYDEKALRVLLALKHKVELLPNLRLEKQQIT